MSPSRATASLALSVACASVAHAWTLGDVCADVNMGNISATPAKDMLRGKHLRVLDLWWMPFAQVDETAPHGWSGLDVDLLDQFSWLLGFTYEMKDMGYPGTGETWTDHVVKWQYEGDLVGSFWVPEAERRNKAIQIRGHLDLSTTLIARREVVATPLNFFSWAGPFTWQLWLCFTGLIILSGVVDFILEKPTAKHARLRSSIREYAAGVLWGGFEYPLSNSSALYQLVLAFILMIINASYTANLAAFITISAAPALSAESIQSMQLNGQNLCVMPGGFQTRFDASYPMMPYTEVEGEATAGEELYWGTTCDAVVTPRNNFDTWKTNADYCNFEVAEVLFSGDGGWMTNRESPCVAYAVEWALYQLEMNGTIDKLYRQYMPVAPCASTVATEVTTFESTSTTARRQLNAHSSERATKPHAGGGVASTATSRRRLTSKSSRPVATAAEDPGASIRMGVLDFVGVFTLWGGTSVILVLITVFWVLKARFCTKKKVVDSVEGEQARVGVKLAPSEFGLPEDINLDNESAMLRALLKQMGGIYREIVEVKTLQDTTSKEVEALAKPSGGVAVSFGTACTQGGAARVAKKSGTFAGLSALTQRKTQKLHAIEQVARVADAQADAQPKLAAPDSTTAVEDMDYPEDFITPRAYGGDV